MNEHYKYKLWRIIEEHGWTVVPIPASGSGRRGIHRPDLILGNGEMLVIAEVKVGKPPVYLYFEKDIEPILRYSKAFMGYPALIVKFKGKKWRIFNPNLLEETRGKSYKLNERNWEKGTLLVNFLKGDYSILEPG
ncbi:MAG: hypothetical protein ACTSSJ_06235 [Candidatus Odinarchaeia archaeon]